MKVLFLTHRLPFAPNRGDRIRAYHILRTLAGTAEVHLVSLVHDREEEAQASHMTALAASVTAVRVPRLRNLARAVCALPTGRPLTHLLLDAPDFERQVRNLAATIDPDILMPYCSGVARLALLPALRSIPCVLDMVDVDSAKWQALAQTTPRPRRWIYGREAGPLSRFEAVVTRHAAATLVVNERERALLSRLAPEARIHIVPNGVDVGTFHSSQPPTEEPRVIFCGVMNYAPNEEGAVWFAEMVWPIVRGVRPDARLSLVGSNPTPRLRRLAERDDSVEVTGWVEDVRPFLWRSAVSVAPLATARGIQNKVLEAVASGLPCVVTPAVYQGLPAEARHACSSAERAELFADELLRLLGSTGVERRAIASLADLRMLEWERTLAPLPGLLAEVAESRVSRSTVEADVLTSKPFASGSASRSSPRH